jgi:hypothetical protein
VNRPLICRARSIRKSGVDGGALFRAPIPLLALLLLLLVPSPARAEEVAVSVDITRDDCGASGSFVVPVPAGIAWEVLTDYDGIGRYVKSMHSSRMERGDDGRKLVRQDAVASAFLVHRHMHVLLEIEEDPGNRIAFHDILREDFRSYVGQWRLSRVSDGTRVEYEVVAVPRSAIARAVCPGTLRNTAHELLEQVGSEMMRRARERDATGSPHADP